MIPHDIPAKCHIKLHTRWGMVMRPFIQHQHTSTTQKTAQQPGPRYLLVDYKQPDSVSGFHTREQTQCWNVDDVNRPTDLVVWTTQLHSVLLSLCCCPWTDTPSTECCSQNKAEHCSQNRVLFTKQSRTLLTKQSTVHKTKQNTVHKTEYSSQNKAEHCSQNRVLFTKQSRTLFTK